MKAAPSLFRSSTALLALLAVLAVTALPSQEKPAPDPAKKSEPHDFLLLGLQLSPGADGLSNMWVVSEGGDFVLIGPLLGGYEIGMFHRITADKLEYRFKTFFNFKWDLFQDKPLGAYVGFGGGLLEILKTQAAASGFTFAVGLQGLIGLKVGPPGKDKFILELQILKTNQESDGLHIHLMAGARF
jgi:hypothetical protein